MPERPLTSRYPFVKVAVRGNPAGGPAKLSFKSWVNQVVLAKLLTLWTHC